MDLVVPERRIVGFGDRAEIGVRKQRREIRLAWGEHAVAEAIDQQQVGEAPGFRLRAQRTLHRRPQPRTDIADQRRYQAEVLDAGLAGVADPVEAGIAVPDHAETTAN